jgi:tetratricopeptide (TPR) repeat protein
MRALSCVRVVPELRKRAPTALNNKVAALNHLGRMEEAIATHEALRDRFGHEAIETFDEVVRKCADATQPAAREQLAGALAAKASLLSELARLDEAIEVFDQILDRFRDDEHPMIERVVAAAGEARQQLLEEQAEDDE